MEAVPRLPMLWFALKSSPEGTSFANLKKYIAECYQENPESYSKEVIALEMLRNKAMRPEKDVQGCGTLKRYYCQLHSLANRFPQLSERSLFAFTWKDLYVNNIVETNDIRFEMAAVLFNIAALHTQVGASVNRADVDGMKLACTHFQCAGWAFGELREKFQGVNNGNDFMTPELLVFMQQISFAQAQECILEKSLIDNRKPAIVAKVTAQIINYYGAGLVALLTGGDDGPIAQVIDSNVFNNVWKKYVKFKITYLTCILYLYQGLQSEEQQKMGERVVLYQAAWNKLEEARKESKGMADQKEIMESLTFTADVVEGKRKSATSENEFIYHEAVPELTDISAVQGANLVNGISFSVTDPEVAGEDIFARLVPMKAHEASSLYSEEKAQILRKYGTKIEEKDNELATFISSLNVDQLNISEERSNKIPQGIVDRCASLNAKTNAIPDLIASMSNLAEICADVETNLKEIKELLSDEDLNEKQFQQKSGVHRSNAHFTELSREFQKYLEAHQKAGESNDTLRRAMELHVNNLRILARPLQDIQSSVPKLSGEVSEEVFRDLKLILNKVNEMKAQRAQFHADLRISINDDDITSKVIAFGEDKDLKELFKKELEKHDKICALIDQNLAAQSNILSALTEAYAKCAPILKTMADVKHKKETFFTSLAASYDVYEDLLAKSAKGLEFYKKLQGNVQKLLARVKAARDVQDEERQQRMKSTNPPKGIESSYSLTPTTKSSTPKLKDYLKSGKAITGTDSTYIPPIRPNPLGSEAPSTSNCVTSTYYTPQQQIPIGSDPPPPYTPGIQQQPYDAYTNSIYQSENSQAMGSNTYYQSQNPQMAVYQQAMGNTATSSYSLPQSASQSQQMNSYQYPTQTDPTSSGTQQYPQGMQYPMQQQYDGQFNYNPQAGYIQAVQPVESISSASINQQQTPLGYSQTSVISNPTYSQQNAPLGYDSSTQPAVPMSGSSHSQNFQMGYGPSGMGSTTGYNQQSLGSSTSLYNQQQNVYNSTAASTASTPSNIYSQQMQSTPSYASPVYSQQNLQTSTTNQQTQPTSYQQNFSTTSATQPGVSYTSPAYSQQNLPVTSATSLTTTVTSVPSTISSQSSIASTGTNWNTTGLVNQMVSLSLQNPQQPSTIYYTYQQQSCDIPQSGQLSTVDSQYAYQQLNSSGVPVDSSTTSEQQQAPSFCAHPGYGYNLQTGNYQYASGYLGDAEIYSQYTNAIPDHGSNTTNSLNPADVGQPYVNQYNNAEQQQQTVQIQQVSDTTTTTQSAAGNVSYYTIPYGYLSTNVMHIPALNEIPVTQNMNSGIPNSSGSTYMQSNHNGSTETTISGTYANSITANTPPQVAAPSLQPQNNSQNNNNTQNIQKSNPSGSTKKQKKPKKSTNIDLLSDIDFSSTGAAISTPPLQPQIATIASESRPSSQASVVPLEPKPAPAQAPVPEPQKDVITTPESNKSLETILAPEAVLTERKSSCDNLSICSDLSSLDHSFDWDSVSVRNEKVSPNISNSEHPSKFKDPFDEPKTLKYFHKEVERYEKAMDSLNIKMLNGNTPLVNKWKELQDLLVKDESKRTTSISKLFPEKNRSSDCIPYDHARVILEKNTDDYINAAYVKDLGPGCPTFILAQTPLQNTVNDFWSMVWAQKARTVVCLHTPNEILDTFWPQEVNKEMHFDDFSVTLVKQFDLSHCIELNLKLTMNGADAILDLSLLQIKAWTKSSPSQILGIAQNVLVAYKQRSQEFKSNAPLIMNCLTGSERSGIIALAICAILATKSKRPTLISVVDVWHRICSQRRGALRDPNNLQLSMQIVLSHAHDVINKRGIMTSYQMKNAQTAAAIEKEEVKDPLNDLDPLWKLKQK